MQATQRKFRDLEHELMSMKFDSMLEYQILRFWRENEPEKVEKLVSKGTLRQTLTETADALWNMQIDLEDKHGMDSTLAASKAWTQLMKLESDKQISRMWAWPL